MYESGLLLKKKGYTLPPPPEVDANTLLLIQPSGGVIKDVSSRNTPVTTFNVTIDNNNLLYGQPTMLFNTFNPGNYLKLDSPAFLALGTSNWTMDLYYYCTNVQGRASDGTKHLNFGFWAQAGGGSNPVNMDLEYIEDSYGFNNLWTCAWQTTSISTSWSNTANGRIVRNKWNHLIYQVRDGVFTIRINGTLLGPGSTSVPNLQQRVVKPFYVGYQNDADSVFTNAWYYTGNIAWYRWSNIARYPNT